MWLYQEREFTESDIGTATGFVYQITNLESGRIYIGKKANFVRFYKFFQYKYA